ncbi:MAG TPA: hypothetical protein VFU36_02155 [Jatrophihabitans sp.]|nr:hypothetical protein [Jatrophihabitans sp.]
MLRNSTRIAAAVAVVACLALPMTASAAATAPVLTAGSTIAVQYIPNEQSPLSYEMDSANHMSWMRTYAVPVQDVVTTGTATLAAGDLTTNHYVYRTISDAQKYDLPPDPNNMSSYQFMPGAQYITSHGDLNLAAGQAIGIVCEASGGQLLAVFQNYVSGATHTWAAWLSAAEWVGATMTGGYVSSC